jgi:hypothetical protein
MGPVGGGGVCTLSQVRGPSCSFTSPAVAASVSRGSFFFVVSGQIEMRDMRVHVLLTLMATDDAEAAEFADYSVNLCLANMLTRNYDLYAGRHGVPATRDQDQATVRLLRHSDVRLVATPLARGPFLHMLSSGALTSCSVLAAI